MSSEKGSAAASRRGTTDRTSGNSAWQNPRVRRTAIYAAILLGVFLLGFVPEWMKARERARERDTAQAALRVSRLQNTLANAAVDTRRGEYEAARQAASEFFTSLRAEMERERDSAFTRAQQESLRGIYASRDDAILYSHAMILPPPNG